jgi:catechol 2,3-dioxygenase-like lactoylglutathione lyase family enzyme
VLDDLEDAEMSRVQLALNVSDLDAAIAFYGRLFATEPAKVRPGYANFAIADPPLKLVLIAGNGTPGSLNHLGVEVETPAEVATAQRRLADEGLLTVTEDEVACCYAVQDKVWVDAPDVPLGAWEFYTVLADDPDLSDAAATSGCCTTAAGDTGPCCAGRQET